MQDRTTAPEPPDLGFEPLLDEEGLPCEGYMSGDQAKLATLLAESLAWYRDREGRAWHIEVNDPVEFLVTKEDDAEEPQRVFPDVYVVCGMQQRPSGVFRLWVVPGQVLDVAVEFATWSSLARDQGRKVKLYASQGVQEYFVFDVHHRKIKGLLEGRRLIAGEYRGLADSS